MHLQREFLAATGRRRQQLVLLHGWASSREIWRPLLAKLRPWADITLFDLPACATEIAADGAIELADVLGAVLAAGPDRAVYLGWSLGGQLALELAARFPERVVALVTVCSNPRFVADGAWPGMPARTFARFRAGFAADSVASLRRFRSLQAQGAEQPRELLRQLPPDTAGPPQTALLRGLEWLGQFDQRQLLPGLGLPQLHLLAEHDSLVPATLEQALQGQLQSTAGARVRVIPGASHLAPLDSVGQLAAELEGFLEVAGLLPIGAGELPAPTKKEVASSFSRAARSYDSVATLQRQVGSQLLALLEPAAPHPTVILDLGCGTGYFRPALRARYPGAAFIGLDLAPGMIAFARARAADDSVWLLGDAESLPLAAESVDLVFSSLAIQWCSRPALLFAELGRVLRPGGRCVFTTLGPATLRELRSAWAAVDAHQHVNTFLPAEELAAAAEAAPGIRLTLKTERHCMQYSRVGELLAELKALGAHNMNPDRPAGLGGRKILQGMLLSYEDWRSEGMLPATYDVIFGEVKKYE